VINLQINVEPENVYVCTRNVVEIHLRDIKRIGEHKLLSAQINVANATLWQLRNVGVCGDIQASGVRGKLSP
jgi:hypothetical protein